LLGSCFDDASGDALRALARAYDPSVNKSRIIAEVVLLHKYLLLQACVGVSSESEVPPVVGGLFMVPALGEINRLHFSGAVWRL